MISKEKINKIIEDLNPLYNQYANNKNDLSGAESLKIMWDIGEIINDYIEKFQIPPHNLFRQIYGKSESNTNITQTSYITREFQGRCSRIRNIFANHEEIDELFPSLVSFTCFREAMPFFDNEKYLFKGQEKKDLLRLLNSNQKPSQVIQALLPLKAKHIGIKNKRDQRLGEVSELKENFIYVYNAIYKLLRQDDYDLVKEKSSHSKEVTIYFYQKVRVLLSEDNIPPDPIKHGELSDPFNVLNDMLERLFSKTKMTERNRFRRLVPLDRISSLSNMIYALSDEKLYNNYFN